MLSEIENRSTAAEITGTTHWLQMFSSPFGAPPAAPAAPVTPAAPAAPSAPAEPVSAPSAPAPAGPDQTHPAFRGGFRLPTGPNPLLQAAPPAQSAPAFEPTPVVQPPAQVQPQGQTPGQGLTPPAQQAPVQQPPAAPQAEHLDFGGRRVPVPADAAAAQALREAHTDWRNQQGALTRAQQHVAELTRRFTAQTPPAGAPGAQPTGQAPAAQNQPFNVQTAIKEAASKIDAETLQNALYENPAQALGNVMEQVLGPVVDGISKQFQSQLQQATEQANSYVQEQRTTEAYSGEIETMTSRPELFPDLDGLRPIMGQVIDAYPHLLQGPNPMQTVYLMARGIAGGGSAAAPSAPASPAPAMTLDAVLANQELVGQLMQHPQIRDQIVRSYLEALRSGQPPVTIGAGSGGVPPATPPTKPTNIREAGMAARAFLGIGR